MRRQAHRRLDRRSREADQALRPGQHATAASKLLIITHLHEHLGQAIAYARMNKVTPPWSAGRE